MSARSPRPIRRTLGRVGTGAARALELGCAVFVAASLATRAVHFVSPSLPPAIDDGVGELMSLEFAVALNQLTSLALLAQAGVVLAVVLALHRLVGWWRGTSRPRRGLALAPWVAVWAWLGLALGNALLDLDPSLLGLLLLTSPALLIAARSRPGQWARAAAVAAAALAVWLAWGPLPPNRFDLVYGSAWIVAVMLAAVLRPRFPRVTDWATAVLLSYAALQAGTLAYDRLPVFRPDPAATIVGEGSVYHWCEIPERRLVYATHVSCDLGTLADCRNDYIAQYDLGRPEAGPRELRFFDEGFYGRMLHLLCLPDRVQVGMAATRLDGRIRLGNVLEFQVDDPTVFSRDVLGGPSIRGIGTHFVHDADRGAVLYASEPQSRLLRVELSTGQRRWIELPSVRRWPQPHRLGPFQVSLPAPISSSPDAVFRERGTAYFAEWMRGSRVVELDLRTLAEVGDYRVNAGGGQQVGVDEGRARLLVTGLWGLEAFDLRTRARTARLRTPFAPRLPVVDAAHDLVYVPLTFGNHVLVLDRASLTPVGRLAVGGGGRLAHLTADGTTLFASGGGHVYAWDVGLLARRFGRPAAQGPRAGGARPDLPRAGPTPFPGVRQPSGHAAAGGWRLRSGGSAST